MKWVNYLKELPRLGNTFSLFSRPNFFSDEKRNPLSNSMMLGWIIHFPLGWWGNDSHCFFLILCRNCWIQLRTEDREQWSEVQLKKNKNNPWLFSFLRAAPDYSQERTNCGLVKSSEYLQERYRLQEKLFLYISILLRNVGYQLLPRWLTAPLLCSLNT